MLPGVGLFGTGSLARILLTHLQAHNFKLVAVWREWACEPEKDKSLQALLSILAPAERGEVFHSRRIDSVVLHPSVQLIVVASFPHLHVQLVSKACRMGKHVLCTFPPALNVPGALSMSLAAAEYPIIALAISPLRFVPAFNIMRELIRNDGVVGAIRFVSASLDCDVYRLFEDNPKAWEQYIGGGLISLFGVHIIDIITYITGMRPKRVNAFVRKLHFTEKSFAYNLANAEDFVTIQMELDKPSGWRAPKGSNLVQSIEQNLVIVSITLNGLQYEQSASHEVKVYGTNGYLVCRGNNLAGKLRSKGHPDKESHFYIDDEHNKMKIASESIPDLHQLGFERFIAAVHNAFSVNEKHHSSPDNLDHHELDTFVVKSASVQAFHANGRAMHHRNSLVEDSQDKLNTEQCVHNNNEGELKDKIVWCKDAVSESATFEDALFVQATVEAIRVSTQTQQWTKVETDVHA